MPLPREPRQKMINVMYLVLTAILALNVSNEVINAFKVVNKSLETSNTNIENSNKTLFESLKEKLNKPESREKALIWAPKADSAKMYSDAMIQYLDSLKLALKKAANLHMRWDGTDSVEDFNMDNLDASTRLFETKGEGPKLKSRLDQYKDNMLNLDPSIKTEFQNIFPVNTIPPVSQEGKHKDFTETFFHMTPTIAALTMLSKFQNNIKNAENMIVTYCHTQIGAVEVHMDSVGILVGQSSSYLMPGQQLQITAGVGAYSSAAAPTISINGNGVKVNGGQGTWTTTVSGSGEHTAMVNVTFKDENGIVHSRAVPVKYVVGTPGGAAVMLDKMNVFYVGLDNPVTINSGTGWDKTNVNISSGSITSAGAPGKFNVRVNEGSIGKTTQINVIANGKTSTFDFRVKRIPDPVFRVGPKQNSNRMQSVVFKNQQYCRADLDNFEFDARFKVIGATVYFTGANFPSVKQDNISSESLAPIAGDLAKCIPGTSVIFDNVRVQGPDGTIRSIPGPGYVLY
jgi:gliding motility-associated protein GldM